MKKKREERISAANKVKCLAWFWSCAHFVVQKSIHLRIFKISWDVLGFEPLFLSHYTFYYFSVCCSNLTKLQHKLNITAIYAPQNKQTTIPKVKVNIILINSPMHLPPYFFFSSFFPFRTHNFVSFLIFTLLQFKVRTCKSCSYKYM